MKVIGLTGGIASGKNFVADILRKDGAVIFDADHEVHQLLKLNQAVKYHIEKHFPKALINQEINKKVLGKIVFEDDEKLKILEKILHPMVKEKYWEFLNLAQKERKEIAVLNIPLLLENKYNCDKIVAIVAPTSVRKKRFLARARQQDPKNFKAEKKNLEKKFDQILLKQISNKERKSQADFVVNSGTSKADVVKQVKRIESLLKV